MGWEKNSEYFSGQGVVMVGFRDANGKPKGLRPVGNVSALSIATAIQYQEHRESQSGDRAVDRRKVSQTDVTYSATWEDFSAENLGLLLRSAVTNVVAGAVTDAVYTGYAGLVTALDHVDISAVTVKSGATSLVAYTDESTPYDYEVNTAGGSIKLNPKAPNLGKVITDITVGATTVLTVASTADVTVGESVVVNGATGADAADLNGKEFIVTAKTATTLTLGVATTGKTITTVATTKVVAGELALSVSYTYNQQVALEALTTPEQTVYLRFEGLNTAENNSPVVIDVFNVSLAPLQELSLIADEFQSFQSDGTVLADPTRKTGSKYYKVRKAIVAPQ